MYGGRAICRPAARAPATPAPRRLVDGEHVVTFGELAEEVAAGGERLAELDLPARSLVVLEATNTIEFVVTYLALLDGGHVPLLAGAHHPALADAWEADARDRDRRRVGHRAPGRADRAASCIPTSPS